MPIEDRNLEAGAVLTARYKKADRTCEVVTTENGLRYRLDDGTEHKSPSSAGKAVTGGACNGWVFWSVQGTETPKRTVRSTASHEPKATTEKLAKAAKGTTKKGANKGRKPKSARAASKSDSYGCGVCDETFKTQKAAVTHAMTHAS